VSTAGPAALRDFVERHPRLLVLTGAGCSTGSGIPDYRDRAGQWKRAEPLRYQAFVGDVLLRQRYWARSLIGWPRLQAARPNAAHRALAALEQRGGLGLLLTQNVDGLHQRSGVPDSKIIELHGNTTYASCLDCGHRHELAPIRKAFLEKGELPLCAKCEGIVKTATISFGQAMPEVPMLRAQEETLACDLFIVLGSSLVVYPAAGFPRLAKRNGAKFVILNRDATDQDRDADLVIHNEIGPTMSRAIGVN